MADNDVFTDSDFWETDVPSEDSSNSSEGDSGISGCPPPPPPPTTATTTDDDDDEDSPDFSSTTDDDDDEDSPDFSSTTDYDEDSPSVDLLFADHCLEGSQRSLVFEISLTTTRVSVFQNGKAIPIESSQYPFQMALVNKRIFIYGNKVEELRAAKSKGSDNNTFKTSRIWNLGRLLHSRSEEIPTAPFIYNKEILSTPPELLLALFFKHLKDLAERQITEDFDNNKIVKVVFSVPLWFASVHRQRLKAAGRIAGFKHAIVVNQMTLALYFHLSDPSTRKSSSDSGSIMVISENSGNVEAAMYEFHNNEESNNSRRLTLDMKTYAGNLFSSGKTAVGVRRNLIKREFQERLQNKNKEKSDTRTIESHRKLVVNTIIEEVTQQYFQDTTKNAYKLFEIIARCEDRQWLPLLLEASKRVNGLCWDQIECVENTLILRRNSSDAEILFKERPKLSWNSCSILDLTPYSFHQTATDGRNKVCHTEDLAEPGQPTIPGRTITSNITWWKSFSRLTFYQKNVLNQEFLIGELQIREFVFYAFQDVRITFTSNADGVLQLDTVCGLNYNKSLPRNLQSVKDYIWKPAYLMESEIERLTLLLPTITETAQELTSKLLAARKGLHERCLAMNLRLKLRRITRRMPGVTNRSLRNKIKEGLGIIGLEQMSLVGLAEIGLDSIWDSINSFYTKYFSSSMKSTCGEFL